MATHDYVISNQSFPSTRTDLNNVLQAIVTNNSNATAPSTTYANMIWYDTANNKLYIRNEDNDAWIELFVLDQTGDHLEKIGNTITLDGAGNMKIEGDIDHKDAANNDRTLYDKSANLLGNLGTIVAANSIGIGTTTPSTVSGFTVLEVAGSSNGGFIKVTDGTVNNSFYNSGSVGFIGTQTNHSIGLITNGNERIRVDNLGRTFIGNANNDVNPASASNAANKGATFGEASDPYFSIGRTGNAAVVIGRIDSDGDLVLFYGDGTAEGSISVSGTTVSYNGGHLSRWSQLTNGTKDTSIVKGTVMTNLDQMAVWSHDAVAATYYVDGDYLPEITPATYYTEDDTLPDGVSVGDEKTAAVYAQVGNEKTPAKDAFTEDNEQLNCMAVSSVEGDTNVAGVFVNWDNDDDQFNDMNVAMTGDMVIRIAQGTTVARGDLLMSAGDGTAKPQDDDIVRSKTIAKVTSTHVSHTYDDGSYLVPCVLMAC